MPDHHAVVLIGDSLEVALLPEAFLVPTTDVVHIITDRLSIDAVRQLVRDALVRPLVDAFRTLVIVARDIPVEAQNALLKVFEEPPVTARFVLIIPRADILQPTLRSRVLLHNADVVLTLENDTFAAFRQASYASRMDIIADLAKNKAVVPMEEILRGAEQLAHESAVVQPKLLGTVVFVRDYFGYSGAAKKMLLEELALSLPVT